MATGFSFGAKTTAPNTFGNTTFFGTSSTQPQSTFNLGGPAPAPNLFNQSQQQQQQPSGGLSFKPMGFGTPSTNAGFNLGGTSTGTGFNFSSTTAPLNAPNAGLSFNVTSTPASTFSFGQGTSSAPSSGLPFGATSAPLSFGLGTNTTTSSLFGATTKSTTAGSGLSLGLNFGQTPNTATTTMPNLFGANTNFKLTTPQPNVGLGGVASAQGKLSTLTSSQKDMPAKEQLLPNEFAQGLDQFKKMVQEQKMLSSEVARCSIKEFREVENGLDTLIHSLKQVEMQLLNNRNLVEKLKFDTAKGLQHIEMAQRTQETPPGLQFDNNAPIKYFLELVDTFDKEMQILKMKIDNTDKYVRKYNEPQVLNSQDLSDGMKRMHDIFEVLAGRMHFIHSQVEVQKEIFLNLYRQTTKDGSNPFESECNNRVDTINKILLYDALKSTPPKILSGPTPFNNMSLDSNNLALLQPNQSSTQTPLNSSVAALPITTTSTSNLTFGSNLSFATSFQLQKPTASNKRGKP